jgi:phenylalanyl-tRNA synthetase alpha chain
MDELLQQIAAYKQEIENQPTNGADSLEAYRIKFLGTKGIVKNLFTEMRNVPADKKKEFGLILNEFKLLAETKYENWKQQLEGSDTTVAAAIDVTLPGDALPLGTRHPINLFLNHVISIFNRLGFSVAEGPEIEDDWHNFTALNLPEHHPARDMQDTFYGPIPATPRSGIWKMVSCPFVLCAPVVYTATKPSAPAAIASFTR